jgi:hypothetical protein
MDAFKCLKAFEERIRQIEQITKAKDALATFDYFSRNLTNLKNLRQDELISKLSEYSRSSPGGQITSGPLNEAAVVLLSAYLEGFVEELHEEATYHLLEERGATAGVLKALLDYAHERFSNPRADRITNLFKSLTINGVISNLRPDVKAGEIDRFVDKRNKIAHGERVTVTNKDIQEWGLLVMKLAQGLTREVVKAINKKMQPVE